MNSFDKITLNAFLAGLMRLSESLSVDLQNQLKEIAKNFPAAIFKLHTVAKKYPPLQLEYMEACSILQNDGGFRSSVVLELQVDDVVEISNEKLMNFAVEVFNADDSVSFVQKVYTESSEIGKFLFQLRRQTSFMVKKYQNIPAEELWVWQDPRVWASLESGLRQAQAGKGRYLGDFSVYADLEIED